MISVIDCMMGNIGSVVNIIKHIGHEAEIVTTPEQILSAEKLIFPGVGHWDNGVEKLLSSGLKPAILEATQVGGTPMMGICLGMQLLFSTSEEGQREGLGLIPGMIRRFNFSSILSDLSEGAKRLRIPHMGWNKVYPVRLEDHILTGLDDDAEFYFVHSFHACDVPTEHQLLTCQYGYEFVCGVNAGKVWGFQFHPEKSHKFGVQLLKNFIESA